MIRESNSTPEKKRRLLDATVRLMLRQGFAATTVDQICTEAGVTKGSFFHYFTGKEQIAQAAIEVWSDGWLDLLARSGLERIPDPLDRLKRLLQLLEETYPHPETEIGCMIGTVAQEVGPSNRTLGDLCERHLDGWAQGVSKVLAEAKAAHPPRVDFDPDRVADLMLAIVQGTLLVARTRQGRSVIDNNLRHCREYVLSLFGDPTDPVSATR
ncbi:MAG: TetR/AcrR family transcriptional regulator [Capsulimonadales bacterium]|nr:TetR/AcrR family transcriptional regulator [Capsulimonadales bacterium]